MNVKKHIFRVPVSKLKNIRGVLLDLDNTIYGYSVCHQAALRSAYTSVRRNNKLSFEEFKRGYEIGRRNTKKRLNGQAVSHSRLLYFQDFFESRFKITPVESVLKTDRAYWDGFFRSMRLYPGVKDFLTWCRKNCIMVCLITDLTAEIQLRKIVHLKIEKLIDLVVSSEEAGADKPHNSIFALALKKLRLSRKEVVMIGDDSRKDIKGARALGIRTVLVK
ncbi:HAD family hydrolase [Patescibacteria group bacterium]|nr:HAD family hydrolase [Patescibacteria group bacterium]